MKEELAGSSPLLNKPGSRLFRARVLAAIAIFLLAFGVRLLTWHDTRFEVGKVQSSVAGDYQRVAELLRQEGLRGFVSASSALADLNNLGHPPGYSILIAAVRSIFGNANTAVQFTQIVFDSLTGVLLFLIVLELFSLAPAAIAGGFAALSPQLAWNSVLLLPDSLAVFPILLAVYLLARSRPNPRLAMFLIMGGLIGISCWLRANAMLLTFFFALAALVLHGRKHWRYSLAVIGGTLLIVLPLTIRNAIATRHFIPLSLGAGQTLLEGIADYDRDGRFGIPNTDMGILRQEAEIYQRPEYYGTLFKPDGVARERARMKRGAQVIASNPVWFASVMVRRAASMTRLERARLISQTPTVTNPLDTTNLKPISRLITTSGGNPVLEFSSQSPHAQSTFDSATGTLKLAGNASNYGKQFASGSFPVRSNFDHLLKLAFKIDQGRMKVLVIDSRGRACASAILEPLEVKQSTEQPAQTILLPFVSLDDSIQIEFSNEASAQPPIVYLSSIDLYELGPASFAWTHIPRLILHGIQRLFITGVFLPLALIGVGLAVLRKRTAALIILSVVPLYYFTVQSAFHTEYRYVLAVNYFLFAFAAVAIGSIIRLIYVKASSLSLWKRSPLSASSRQSNR